MINLLDSIIKEGSGNTHKGDCTTKQKRQVRENSYSNVIRQYVQSLNVAKEEQQRYYSVVHTIMAEAGIIDSQMTVDANQKDKRYKPFDKSPYGKFVEYERVEGGRKRVNSYLLNEVGMSKVKEILTTHVTDRYLTKNQIQSAKGFRNELQSKMDVEFLKTYLEHKGIPFKDGLGRVRFCAPSIENENKVIPYTCYYNNSTALQYKSTKRDKDFNTVFWFIHSLEIPSSCNDAQEKAIRVARIFREYWNLQFNGKTEWGDKSESKTSTEPVQSVPGTEASIQQPTMNISPDFLVRLERMEGMMAAIMKALNLECPVPTEDLDVAPSTSSLSGKTAIISMILNLTSLVPTKNRYKTISLEQIAKENKPERKRDLQQAYDILNERRLLTAKYRPEDGWKFDFNQRSIELQYRVSKQKSAVYCSRHRPLDPPIIDGKLVKEKGDKGQSYPFPYGLEKVDYTYKTIFVAEGIYDSCFLKNCLAQSNWILPCEMSKVIDIYRDAGFQIIHLPDNFRIGDKGGLKFIHHVLKTKDWLSKGDKVFNWSIYSDCDDLNKIAMTYELDEIDAQSIIDNSWGEDEVRENYDKHFTEWLEVLRQKCSKEEWEGFMAGLGASYKATVDEVAEQLPVEQDYQSPDFDDLAAWLEFLSADEVKRYVKTTVRNDDFEDFLAELEAEQQQAA